ncbi:hypothetical protein PoB_007557400 [Plakobranchus ocellatus]|uniref:Uncharacterized protein n=1 Tax=Plakobranchus ocellatus TaxID=259542 RepID=A0AAV4DYC9_9GAST|nr:hypothetical protein PoB_007557400 [Plakobranchus ocellatus]
MMGPCQTASHCALDQSCQRCIVARCMERRGYEMRDERVAWQKSTRSNVGSGDRIRDGKIPAVLRVVSLYTMPPAAPRNRGKL